jgi:hypothetical protein
MYKTIVASLLVASCGGSGGGKNDDAVGGEEKIVDSFSCVAKVPSLDKDGEPDKVRGFDVKVVAFVYSKQSSAMTLETTYNFNEKDKYSETVSRVFPQSEKKHKLESDLLLVKVGVVDKSMEVFKKHMIGDSFEGECK